MRQIIKYARVTTDACCNEYCPIMDISQLHPIIALRVVIEQYYFADYLNRVDNHEVGNIIYEQAQKLYNQLPSQIAGTYTVYNELYQSGLQIIQSLNRGMPTQINFEQLLDLYRIGLEGDISPKNIYRPSLDIKDIAVLHNLATGYIHPDMNSRGEIYGANLLLPSIRPCSTVDPEDYSKMDRITNEDSIWQCIVAFSPFASGSYTIGGPCSGLLEVLSRFSLPNTSIVEFLGILSYFSLSRDKYIMTNFKSGRRVGVAIQDVCFDLVTYSKTIGISDEEQSGRDVSRFRDDIDTIVRMVESGKITKLLTDHKLTDKQLPGSWLIMQLLRYYAADPQLVRYFTVPTKAITAQEAWTFEKSVFSKLFPSRVDIMAAMEDATNDDDSFDLNSNDDNTQGNDQGGDDNSSGSFELDSKGDTPDNNGEADDKEDEDKVNHRPEIDPKMMILELASPAESLTDYLYRDLVSRRISYVLENPPANATPEVLQILRTWKSQWLFIVSIPTIRDFLTRIAIRLS